MLRTNQWSITRIVRCEILFSCRVRLLSMRFVWFTLVLAVSCSLHGEALAPKHKSRGSSTITVAPGTRVEEPKIRQPGNVHSFAFGKGDTEEFHAFTGKGQVLGGDEIPDQRDPITCGQHQLSYEKPVDELQKLDDDMLIALHQASEQLERGDGASSSDSSAMASNGDPLDEEDNSSSAPSVGRHLHREGLTSREHLMKKLDVAGFVNELRDNAKVMAVAVENLKSKPLNVPLVFHSFTRDRRFDPEEATLRTAVSTVVAPAFEPFGIHITYGGVRRHSGCGDKINDAAVGCTTFRGGMEDVLVKARKVSAAYAEDTTQQINVFLFRHSPGLFRASINGLAPQPWWTAPMWDPQYHSVFVDVDLFSPRRASPTRQHTLVHELGHFFGLMHTFESGCSPPSDFIHATPPQKLASSGCNAVDSCGTGRLDAVHNYMDYSSCSTKEFVPEQGLWMRLATIRFRPWLGDGGAGGAPEEETMTVGGGQGNRGQTIFWKGGEFDCSTCSWPGCCGSNSLFSSESEHCRVCKCVGIDVPCYQWGTFCRTKERAEERCRGFLQEMKTYELVAGLSSPSA